MKIGITGGIGSGKSYVCQRLTARGYEVYDCDSAAKRLMRTSSDLQQQMKALVGSLEKADIAKFLLESEANAHAIDAIVHPAVFHDFETSGMKWMESAILFESGAYRLVDKVIVVTAPEEVRIQRVMQRDGISREKVLEWMARQLPQEEVRRRADFEIVNDGEADIDQQIEEIINQINNKRNKKKKETILAFATDRITSLGDIAMFTETDDVPLMTVLDNMKTLEDGKKASINEKKASGKELQDYFTKVLPEWDRDRVQNSHIKKLITWYNILIENGITDFKEETEETKEEASE